MFCGLWLNHIQQGAKYPQGSWISIFKNGKFDQGSATDTGLFVIQHFVCLSIISLILDCYERFVCVNLVNFTNAAADNTDHMEAV